MEYCFFLVFQTEVCFFEQKSAYLCTSLLTQNYSVAQIQEDRDKNLMLHQ